MTLEQNNGGEFRFYTYDPEDGTEPVDLLSVTSIRNLCGLGYQLVAWQMSNIADAALGTMKRTVVGPRGGVSEKRQVWEYPCQFAQMYDAAVDDEGQVSQAKVDELHKWLRAQADGPRNVAAVRGLMVHEAIEKDVAWDRIERPYVEDAFLNLSARDRKAVQRAVSDEDVFFVRNAVRHYWDMRADMPMSILAREVRIVNLEVGYAGTFDALVWLHGTLTPEGDFIPLPDTQQVLIREFVQRNRDRVTLADVLRLGGTPVLLDWKTSKGVHTDQTVQAHAYLAAEFAVVNGKRDVRVTALLNAAQWGGIVHIRPSGWALHLFPYADEAVRAFLGSVAFARFLARYPKPEAIFTHTFKGESNEQADDGVD